MNARALESILSLPDGALGSRGTWVGKSPLLTAEQAQTFGGVSARVLALGVAALDDVFPQRGLACGSVTELQVSGPSGAATTSFALCACRAALSAGRSELVQPGLGQQPGGNWCAFIDPTGTLFAPGVAQLGIDLDRLLVVRPDVEAIGRVAVRIAEANFASVLVIDLRGALDGLSVDERLWQRTIRRLSLIVKSTATCVLVLTRARQFQSLPLPTFMRLEFTRTSKEAFKVRVAKDRTGRVSAPHVIPWSVFDAPCSMDVASSAVGADFERADFERADFEGLRASGLEKQGVSKKVS